MKIDEEWANIEIDQLTVSAEGQFSFADEGILQNA